MITLPSGQVFPPANNLTFSLRFVCANSRCSAKGWALLLLTAAWVATTGCVAIIPTVSQGRGRVLMEADASFIKVGETTREEVIRKLGTDFSDTWHTSALAYSWELKSVDLNLAAIGSMGGAVGGQIGISRWRALFIAFDSKGIVTKRELFHLSPGRSLHEQLTAWESRKTSP